MIRVDVLIVDLGAERNQPRSRFLGSDRCADSDSRDWFANNEDKVFQTVLTAVMVALAGAGWGIADLLQRRRVAVEA